MRGLSLFMGFFNSNEKESIPPKIKFEVQFNELLTVDYCLSLVNSPQSTVHG